MGKRGCGIDHYATGRPLALLDVSILCRLPSGALLWMLLSNLLVGCRFVVNVCENICILGGCVDEKAVWCLIWMGIAKISM